MTIIASAMPSDKAAGECPGGGAEAADRDGDEALEAEGVAEVWIGGGDRADEGAAEPGDDPAEEEGEAAPNATGTPRSAAASESSAMAESPMPSASGR